MLENQILNAESSREAVLHSQFATEIEWENGLQKATKPGLSDARRLLGSGLVARVLEFEVLDRAEPARWAPRRRFTLDKKLLFLSEFPRSAFFMTIAIIDIDGGRHYSP